MGVLATESFTGASGALPNPPWLQKASFDSLIRDGSGHGGTDSAGSDGIATRNDIAPPADQYSQFKITAINFKFAIVRASSNVGDSAYDHYCYVTNGSAGTSYIAKRVNGTETIILALGVATTIGDVVRIEVTGNSPATLTAFKQTGGVGAFVQMGSSATDSDFTSGSFGLGTDTAGAVDDWEGGDFLPSTTPLQYNKTQPPIQQRMAA